MCWKVLKLPLIIAVAHIDVSGRSFRQHPVSHAGATGHLMILSAKAWFLMSCSLVLVNVFGGAA
jgi:hypothetical protein